MTAQTMLPGLEAQPGEAKPIRKLRFIGSLEVDAETFDALSEYAELRGVSLQIACQECLTRFFAERASGVDAMRRHDKASVGDDSAWSQRPDFEPEVDW